MTSSNNKVSKYLKRLIYDLPRKLRNEYSRTFLFLFLSSIFECLVIFAIYPLTVLVISNDKKIDQILPNFFLNYLGENPILKLSCSFIILILVSYFLKLKSISQALFVSAKIGNNLSKNLLRKELSSDLIIFTSRNSANIDSSLLVGINSIVAFIIYPINIIVQSISFVLLLFIITIFNAPITLNILCILLIIIYISITIIVRKKLKLFSLRKSIFAKSFTSILNIVNGNYREIRINQNASHLLNLYSNNDLNFRLLAAKSQLYSLFPKYTFDSIIILSLIGILIYSISEEQFIINSIPILLTVALGIQKLIPYLQNCYSSVANIYSNIQFLEDYYVNYDRHINNKILNVKNIFRDISYDSVFICSNLNYKYNKSQENILKDINFDILPSESLCIVGSSGSGKSTLMDLLLGLLIQEKGDIGLLKIKKFNKGLPFSDSDIIKNHQVQNCMSYISQNGYIYNDSILWNLIPFKPLNSYSKNDYLEIDNILKIVHLYDFINSLPERIYSLVGDSGALLSGGQKQRLILARALLRKKRYLFADEITSALNNDLSINVIDNVIKYQKSNKNSIIMITHNRDLIPLFDKVLDLDKKLNN